MIYWNYNNLRVGIIRDKFNPDDVCFLSGNIKISKRLSYNRAYYLCYNISDSMYISDWDNGEIRFNTNLIKLL